jgi:uncharacterized protein (TIGR02231 family)
MHIKGDIMAEKTITETTVPVKGGKIENVTLFNKGAEIVRTYSVNLEEGTNKVLIAGFVNDKIISESISVELVSGKDSCKIYAVDFNKRMARLDDTGASTLKLETERADATEKLMEIEEKIKVLDGEVALLSKTDYTELKVADIKELSKFYSARMAEIATEKLKLGKQKVELELNKKIIESRLGTLKTGTFVTHGEIGIEVFSAKKQSVNVQLSYSIQNASWSPKYDLRVNETDKGVESKIAMRAEVRQSTDEDWSGVKLTLSSATQTLGVTEPHLSPWYLNAYDNTIRASFSKRMSEKTKMRREVEGMVEYCKAETFECRSDEMAKELEIISAGAITTENNISVDFELPSKQTIATGKSKTIDVVEKDVTAKFNYYAVPKLNKSVFYMMEIEDFNNLNLLVGEISIFYNDKFIGTTALNLDTLDEALKISLGQEKNIHIKYEPGREHKKKGIFGGSIKESRSFTISVHNLKKRKVNLQILDQLPVSMDKVLVIEATEISGAVHTAETGQLAWELDLADGAKKELSIKYTISYPSGRYIG